MNVVFKQCVLLLGIALTGCASSPEVPETGDMRTAESELKTLRDILPGAYSNFAWSLSQDAGTPVIDVRIRQLKTPGEPVFLFERYQRVQEIYGYDLYWLKLDPRQQRPVLYFTHLNEDELSQPMQDTLTEAWQRVLPGCVIQLQRQGNRFTGATNPDICVYTDPLRGQTRLSRRLSTDGETLTIETVLGTTGDPAVRSELLELQKHRTFKGWASYRVETPGQDKPGDWQLSQVFEMRDDGRVNQIYDQQMSLLDYGLQLARLHRFDGEPAYYKLSVINIDSGQVQAYRWFDPTSEKLEINQSWFQAYLAPVEAEEQPP